MSEKYLGKNSTPILINQVKDKLEENYKVMGQLGAKNLISYPYYTGKSYTTNGITFNANDDGSVTLNGTSTGWTSFYLNRDKALKAGTYIISSNPLPKNVYLTFKDLDNNINYNCTEGTQSITLSFDEDFLCNIFFQTQPNVTLDNFVIYPMLRYATDIDPTWQPYAPTNRELFLNKMDNVNPTGTGALSINRKANTTIGVNSVTEGNDCTASANYSHAEGDNSRATSIGAHAEGNYSVARGSFSHAEGRSNANGAYSHTQNYNTIAENNSQTAIGKNNDNKSTTLFEVGNGADADNRSNAFEVYSDGSLSTDNGTTKVKLEDVVNNINDIWKVNGELGAKNLISYPYLMTTKTNNGVTITDNGDGTLTVNGTAQTAVYFNLCNIDFGDVAIGSENSEYIMSDGVDHSLNLEIGYNPRNKITSLNIWQGAILDNVTVYPMIRYKSDTDDTWMPYIPSNKALRQELNNDINDIWKTQEELGAKNLIKYPYYSSGTTVSGITFAANNDGSIYMNGTSISYATYHIFRLVNGFKKGNYIISCEGLTQGVEFQFGTVIDGTFNVVVSCNATSPSKSLIINSTYDDVIVGLRVMVQPNQAVDNITVYPMIRLALDPIDTWTPYVPSNKELYDMVIALQQQLAQLSNN